ncbi:YecR family lipoprotein [Salmonella enterica]|uniref:YecR family lipoprotein n=1 Tax=Salmonella enterica TaxID=28901 RepID=UPI003D319D2E
MKAIPKAPSVISVLFAFSAPFILSGCAVSELSSTGGSRADGTIVMSVEYGGFDYLDINQDKALNSAIRRCQSWGYRTAQPFDAGFSKCSDFSGFGCTRYIYSISYQCIE